MANPWEAYEQVETATETEPWSAYGEPEDTAPEEDAIQPWAKYDTDELDQVADEDPTTGEIVKGVGVEMGTSVGGSIAGGVIGGAIGSVVPVVGTALGAAAGTAIGGFAGGFLGSLWAQDIEGQEDKSLGRALGAGVVSAIPMGGAAAKGVKGAGKITASMVGRAAGREAVKGAALGGTEVTIKTAIDEGRMPTKEEYAQYAGAGALFGGAMGAVTPKVSKTMDKFFGKTFDEIDDAIASGDIDYKDLEFVLKQGTPSDIKKTAPSMEGLLRKEVAETTARKQSENAVNELLKAEQIARSGQGKVGKFLASIMPSKYVGQKTNQAAIDFKRKIVEAEELGSRIANRTAKVIKKDPSIEDEMKRFLDQSGGGPVFMSKKLYDAAGADLMQFQDMKLDLQNRMLKLLDDKAFAGLDDEAAEALRMQIQDSISGKAYNRREYRKFLDKDFVEDPKAREAAFQELSEKMGPQKAKEHMDKLDNASAATKADDPRMFFGSAVDGVLKRRHNPGKAEREWLGEVVESPERMRGTLSGLARSVARAETDSFIAKELLDSGIGTTSKRAGLRQVVLRGTGPEGTGVYVNPEVQTALNQIYLPNSDKGMDNIFLDGLKDLYSASVAGSKASKVLLNTVAYPVQLYGNTANLIGMGINPFKGASRGAHLALAEFGGIEGLTKNQASRRAMLKEIQEMSRFGLKGSNVLDSDIRSGLKEGFFSKQLGKITDPLGKAYSVPDTMGRYVGWKANQQTLRKIFPDASDDVIKRQAAHMINDTYQNYDKLSNVVRTLSRWGVMPQFASFTAEFMRNQYNQGKIIAQMMRGTYGQDVGLKASKAGITAMRKEGAKRLASLMAVYGGTYGALEGIKSASGVSKEKEDALRDVAYADWDKDKNLAVKLNPDGRSGWTANPSYVVPHALGVSALKAGMSGQDDESLIRLLSNELVGDGSFIMQEAFRALSNRDRYGRDITVERDDLKAAQDRMAYFIRESFKPGFSRELAKLKDAKLGRGDLKLKEVGMRQLGARMNPFKVEDRAKSTMRQSHEAAKVAKSNFNRVRKKQPTQAEFEKAYQDANRINKDVFNSLLRNNQSLTTLGFSEDERIQIMKDSGISSKDILNILEGDYVDIPRVELPSTSDIYDSLPDGRSDKLKAIRSIMREDRQLGSRLMNTYERERRQSKLSEREKLFKRMDSGERVRHIRSSEDPKKLARSYLAKGLISEDIYFRAVQ